MNFGTILQNIYDTVGYAPATPDSMTIRRIKAQVNNVYRDIMGRKGFGPLRQAVLTFPSVAGIPDAVLPLAASRIIIVVDRTNMQPLDKRTLQEIRFDDPGQVASAAFPYEYWVENLASATFRDPTTADSIFLKSTNAADNTQTVYMDVILSTGGMRSLSVALNGTTAVNLSAAVSNIVMVKKFYLSAVAQGEVVATQTNGSGTEIARIPIGKTFSRYSRIGLHPTPTGVNTYYADVELSIDDLVNNSDEPLLDEDFHWLLECGVLMKEYNTPRRQLPIQYANEKSRWNEGISNLTAQIGRAHV